MMREFSAETLEQAGLTPSTLHERRLEVVDQAYAHVRRFIAARALIDVFDAYGERPDGSHDIHDMLSDTLAMASRHLDYRQGAPRRSDVPTPPSHRAEALRAYGDETGLTRPTGVLPIAVDVGLVQGSYWGNIWQRTQLAVQQREYQPDHPLLLIGQGNDRGVTAEDIDYEVTIDRAATNEFELVNDAFRRQLKEGIVEPRLVGRDTFVEAPDGTPYSTPGILHSYTLPDDTDAYTILAPKIEGRPAGFASTADTHAFTSHVMSDDRLLDKVVMGTTASIYAGFQQSDMMRLIGLPYGATVVTASHADPRWTKPAHIGQELISTLDQGQKLLASVDAFLEAGK